MDRKQHIGFKAQVFADNPPRQAYCMTGRGSHGSYYCDENNCKARYSRMQMIWVAHQAAGGYETATPVDIPSVSLF